MRTFCQDSFLSAIELNDLYKGSVMTARIVSSQVESGATLFFFSKYQKAFSASSCVENPLVGTTGSSGLVGRAGICMGGGKEGCESCAIGPGIPGRTIAPVCELSIPPWGAALVGDAREAKL